VKSSFSKGFKVSDVSGITPRHNVPLARFSLCRQQTNNQKKTP
jgi:hypothetical protein